VLPFRAIESALTTRSDKHHPRVDRTVAASQSGAAAPGAVHAKRGLDALQDHDLLSLR